MTDLGVVKTPMFHAIPPAVRFCCRATDRSHVMLDGAFSSYLHAGGVLLLGVRWVAALGLAR